MKTILAALILISFTANAAEDIPSDRPVAVSVTSGIAVIEEDGVSKEVNLPPGLYFNQAGANKITGIFSDMQQEIAGLKGQNDRLKAEVDKVVAEPPFNWKAAVIIAVSALAVGAAVGVSVALTVKK